MAKGADSLQPEGLLFKTVLDNLAEGVYIVDAERRIQYWSAGAERLTGYSAQEVRGQSCGDCVLVHVDGRGNSLCENGCPLSRAIKEQRAHELKAFLQHKEGHRVPMAISTAPVFGESGDVLGAVEVFRVPQDDAVDSEDAERLREKAFLDELTQLNNRRHAEQELDQRLLKLRVDGSLRLSALLLDIDAFKELNDEYGSPVGDVVLRMVSRTVKGALRRNDYLARWGGKEFLVLAEGYRPLEVEDQGERLRALVAQSSRDLTKGRLRVTVSVGAYFCRQGDERANVVKRLDQARRASQAKGGNAVSARVDA